MSRVIAVVALLALCAPPVRADEGAADAAIYAGLIAGLGHAATEAALWTAFDVSAGREPSLLHGALELSLSMLNVSGGAAVLAWGIDQRYAPATGFGAAMLAVSLPPEAHAIWALTVGKRRRASAGAVELGFGLAQLAAGAGVMVGFATDPAVRPAWYAAPAVLMVPAAALAAHGAYLVATRRRAPPLTLAPAPLPGGLALTAVGQF